MSSTHTMCETMCIKSAIWNGSWNFSGKEGTEGERVKIRIKTKWCVDLQTGSPLLKERQQGCLFFCGYRGMYCMHYITRYELNKQTNIQMYKQTKQTRQFANGLPSMSFYTARRSGNLLSPSFASLMIIIMALMRNYTLISGHIIFCLITEDKQINWN